MEIRAIKTRIFRESEDLFPFILKYVKKIKENSILVVTSKIVALSEGRVVAFKNEKQRVALIKKESNFAIKTKHKNVWLTIKDGTLLPNAGIDESNARGQLILLPKNSFQSAEVLRRKIMQKFHLKNFGVLITDSRVFPLRTGAVGMALGYAGFRGVRNYIGERDIFGRMLKMSKTDVADSVATAAILCMGEGKERQPLALIKGAPVEFTEKVNKKELQIHPKKDLYLPLFGSILKRW
jgi:coenzyme F420-0:L-glutamate ligase